MQSWNWELVSEPGEGSAELDQNGGKEGVELKENLIQLPDAVGNEADVKNPSF